MALSGQITEHDRAYALRGARPMPELREPPGIDQRQLPCPLVVGILVKPTYTRRPRLSHGIARTPGTTWLIGERSFRGARAARQVTDTPDLARLLRLDW